MKLGPREINKYLIQQGFKPYSARQISEYKKKFGMAAAHSGRPKIPKLKEKKKKPSPLSLAEIKRSVKQAKCRSPLKPKR